MYFPAFGTNIIVYFWFTFLFVSVFDSLSFIFVFPFPCYFYCYEWLKIEANSYKISVFFFFPFLCFFLRMSKRISIKHFTFSFILTKCSVCHRLRYFMFFIVFNETNVFSFRFVFVRGVGVVVCALCICQSKMNQSEFNICYVRLYYCSIHFTVLYFIFRLSVHPENLILLLFFLSWHASLTHSFFFFCFFSTSTYSFRLCTSSFSSVFTIFFFLFLFTQMKIKKVNGCEREADELSYVKRKKNK